MDLGLKGRVALITGGSKGIGRTAAGALATEGVKVAICARGDEHLCNAPRQLGVNVAGGYADHVLVPLEKYLLDYAGIPEGLAATYMCSGLTAFSALKKIDPPGSDDAILIVGVGGVYYRVIPEAFNLTIGAQAVVSVPTAAVAALGLDGDLLDPLVTGVVVVRWPIPETAYGVLLTASTNGQFGLGITLMNINFLPVLP